jgi:hypothetical protein
LEDKKMVTEIIQNYRAITEDKPKIKFEATQTLIDCDHLACVFIVVTLNTHYDEWGKDTSFIIGNKDHIYWLMVSFSYIDCAIMTRYNVDMRKKMNAHEIYKCSFQVNEEKWNERVPNSPLNLQELCRLSIRKHIVKCNPGRVSAMTNKCRVLQYVYSQTIITPYHDAIAQLPLTKKLKNYLNFWQFPEISEKNKFYLDKSPRYIDKR